MNFGIPFLGAFSNNEWKVIKSLESGPFLLVALYGFNGVKKHSNSEGWEKYECYFNLTLMFKGLGNNPALRTEILRAIDSKTIDPKLIQSWFNNGICEAYFESEEKMIDFY